MYGWSSYDISRDILVRPGQECANIDQFVSGYLRSTSTLVVLFWCFKTQVTVLGYMDIQVQAGEEFENIF